MSSQTMTAHTLQPFQHIVISNNIGHGVKRCLEHKYILQFLLYLRKYQGEKSSGRWKNISRHFCEDMECFKR